jgi:hypothetical protein
MFIFNFWFLIDAFEDLKHVFSLKIHANEIVHIAELFEVKASFVDLIERVEQIAQVNGALFHNTIEIVDPLG